MPARGWKLESVNEDPVKPDALVISAARLCFIRIIEGTEAYYAVWFPRDFGDKTDDFGVEVTASHDGDAWC